MSDDDTRPNFLGIARSLGKFKDEAEASMRRQMHKKKAKDNMRPTKFCRICETTFDIRKKPTIIVSEGMEAPLKTGTCTKCKKEIENGFAAVKLKAIEPQVLWVTKTGSRKDWPELTEIDNTKLFEALKAKINGEKVDTSEYEQKLQNKNPSEGSPE